MTSKCKSTLPSPLGHLPAETARNRDMAQRLNLFLATATLPYSRENTAGHITASAFILNESRDKILLMHHAKLDRWLQPGGHCDGIEDTHFVALKEAYEETGLTHIASISKEIFDVDIHEIPARNDTGAHLHYDIRYLFTAKEALAVPGNHESHAVEWVSLASAMKRSDSLALPLSRLEGARE